SAVLGGYGNAGDEIRPPGGERPAAGRRFAQWARAQVRHACAGGGVHRRASLPAALRPARPAATRQRADATTLVERALLADAGRCAAQVVVTSAGATRWASATFTGARHRFELAGTADTASLRWLSALPEAELGVRGHLVADLVVERHTRDRERFTATIEVLTVEEA
ncbi:MAG TPA: hypothetical protein VE913_17735, partial [Longimicrobium sp.]|nr:hypothetical protein [Longimicrobium sp.]